MPSATEPVNGGEVPSVISVLIAAYNAGGFITRAIGSVQAQTLDDWEIIVADDASGDDTCRVVRELAAADARIRLLETSKNGGPSRARNRALAEAGGEWVAVLDADDAWRPTRLARLSSVAAAQGLDLVADNLVFFDDGSGEEIGAALTPSPAVRPLTASDVLLSERPWPGFRYGFLKPLIRMDFLKSHRLAYRESYRYAEDFMLLSELLLSGAKAAVLEEPLYVYTVQMNSLSGRKSGTSRSSYDPEQRLRIAGDLIAKFGDSAGADERRSLQLYARWMRDVCDGYASVNGLRAREPHGLGRLLTTSPRALAVYLQTTPTWKRLVQRTHDLLAGRPAAPTLRRRIM